MGRNNPDPGWPEPARRRAAPGTHHAGRVWPDVEAAMDPVPVLRSGGRNALPPAWQPDRPIQHTRSQSPGTTKSTPFWARSHGPRPGTTLVPLIQAVCAATVDRSLPRALFLQRCLHGARTHRQRWSSHRHRRPGRPCSCAHSAVTGSCREAHPNSPEEKGGRQLMPKSGLRCRRQARQSAFSAKRGKSWRRRASLALPDRCFLSSTAPRPRLTSTNSNAGCNRSRRRLPARLRGRRRHGSGWSGAAQFSEHSNVRSCRKAPPTAFILAVKRPMSSRSRRRTLASTRFCSCVISRSRR